MKLHALVLVASIAGMAMPNAASANPVVLKPSSGWALDSDDASCALVRLFEDGDGVMQLELRQFSPGGWVRMQIVSTERQITNRSHMAYRFEPETAWREKEPGTFGYFGLREKYEGVVFDASIFPTTYEETTHTAVAPNDPAMLEQLGIALNSFDAISLSDIFGDQVTLQTGALMQPFTAMRQCLDKSMEKRGLDPFVQDTLSKRPVPLNIKGIAAAVQRGYPEQQLIAGKPAIIEVMLTVDSSGKTTDCAVHGPLSDEAFHKAACKYLRGMKFEPALDARGQPVASFWETRVYYTVDFR